MNLSTGLLYSYDATCTHAHLAECIQSHAWAPKQVPTYKAAFPKVDAGLFDLDFVCRFGSFLRHILISRSAALSAKDNLGMPVCAGVNTHANCPSDGLGHLSLIDGSQAGHFAMHDPALPGDELGDHGKIL